MKHAKPEVVEKDAKAVRPSRRDLLLQAAAYFESRPEHVFGTVDRIEYYAENVIRTRDTLNTAFAPIVVALNTAGIPAKQNLGSVMDNLPMTREEAHDFACNCNGREMTGAALAQRLRTLAASS